MIAIQQSVRTFITAALAFFCYYYLKLAEGYWLVLTATLLVQINPNNFFWRDVFSPFICGLWIAGSVIAANFLVGHFLVLACLLACVTFICVYVGLIKSEFFLATLLINFLVIVTAGMPVSPVEMPIRMHFIMMGGLLASLVKILFWPPGVKRHLRQQIANYLQAIDQLQKYIFWIYVARNYEEKHFFYEKELHRQRLCVLHCMANIKLLNKKPDRQNINIQLEKLFEVTVALGDMRYRVKDFSTFEMSEKEFIAISNALSAILNQAEKMVLVNKVKNLNHTLLLTQIAALEDVTRSALQIASAEPIVFVIFIQYLRSLNDEIETLMTTLMGGKT